jgi:ParB family chromosome partitioning protein
LDRIRTNPLQPRKRFADHELEELVESIRQYGIIQPLIVTERNGDFELIAGERRLRSAKALNLPTVPVIVREADEQEKLELALIENIQREDLNPVETALAFRKLIDEFNLSQEELAVRVSKSRPAVTNTLRLLNLPEEIQLALVDGRLSEGHAKLLVGIEGEAKQMSLFRKIVHSGLSVNDTATEARRLGGTKQARIKINYADKDKEFAFREFFGCKAEVKRKGKGGQVILEFYSDEELQAMMLKMRK